MKRYVLLIISWTQFSQFQLKDKISVEDKKTILDKCKEIIQWLNTHQTAEKEEFESQLKEAEAVCNPILNKYC